jgi:error-prone DNA polymerase
MFGSLHTRSHFSFLAGASSPEELVERAHELGHDALALTDRGGTYGAVRLQRACERHGMRAVMGAEVSVHTHPLVLLARDHHGYAALCALLTTAHQRSREVPDLTLDDLHGHVTGLLCIAPDVERACLVRSIFGDANTFVGLTHYRRPGDTRRARALHRDAHAAGLRTVLATGAMYARRDDYRTYDIMTCIRNGVTIFEPHAERPVNDEQHLRSQDELLRLLPFPDAAAATAEVLERCTFNILPGHVTPPRATLPEGVQPQSLLEHLCRTALPERYPAAEHAQATALLEKELRVIGDLELADFFLIVWEVVREAKLRGIRCSGRGSAANSIVAYLLGITGVDPIRHHLLFERFLHRGRKGTPDIDVDFDSDRREDVIAWMEERFGIEQTAMTATLITYRLRMAIRDVAKALGWPMEIVNAMSKAVPGYTTKPIADYAEELSRIVGDSPLLHVALTTVERLLDRPRHLGLHSGGMILSERPLHERTPVQRSANGVKVVQFDKDDVEAMGLVKFDVLGLRMLACISETLELIERHEGVRPEIDDITLDDPAVFDLICRGETLGVFQIESQGQMHLLAQHQPSCFDDLVTEVALFRPGPLQGGMVNPYVKRRRGQEPVTYLHPDLEPILSDTLGIVLFQEQILEIAHHFAGMSLQEADDFRSLVSKHRSATAMEALRDQFVHGAMRRGVDHESAEKVFEIVAHFVGYGFCRSHAAAFAKTVYQSAWLKLYHPAAYLAAFMQHRPGMYNLMTLEDEARRCGVGMLLPDINRSHLRYELERDAHGRLCIRKPLTSVRSCTQDAAKCILWARLLGPFTSVEDLVRRCDVHADVFDALALSGALDTVAGGSRSALWQARVALRRVQRYSIQGTLFDEPLILPEDVPPLPPLRAPERLSFDYRTHGAARVHPMTLYRRALHDLEVRTIATSRRVSGGEITVAGIVILRQSPPTAHGVLFVTIEDETGFVQCVVQPEMRERFRDELRAASLIVRARVHAVNTWRGLVVTDVRPLVGVIGGYYGHPAMYGGTDTMELRTEVSAPIASVAVQPATVRH